MSHTSSYSIALFSGNANLALSKNISDIIGIPLMDAEIDRFSDGEIHVEITSSVRGHDAYVIQPTCSSAKGDNLLELLIMIDAIKRSSSKRITAVIPYYGYSRQDKRSWSARVPISARLVANMLTTAGADRILTVDLHAEQIQGFFNIPVDNLFASTELMPYLKAYDNPLIVSPDVGGVVRARSVAKSINAELAIIDKRREKHNHSEVMHVIGDVKGRHCVLLDDVVDTAGTLCKAADTLTEYGALSVDALVTHPVLSGRAVETISQSSLNKLVVFDTIPLSDAAGACAKIETTSIADLIADAIQRIHNEDSMHAMYKDRSQNNQHS